ncbi:MULTISPECIES: hypothetical protein [Sphingobacterium]|uniref:Anti-sigma factor n=1 Tax=Sphingobacterium populi TaxID=1812824 RepID=A0ABW5UF51_9SPHI|nr:hypothetical protein [Sphingobacterium sp. CFCC 11742]
MKDQDIDKLFRDALEGEEATPKPQLWDKIAQQLDEEMASKKDIVPLIPVAKKRKYLWMPYAAACTLVGVGLFAYFTNQNEVFTPQPSTAHLPAVVADVDSSNQDSAPSHTQAVKDIIRTEKQLAYSPATPHQEESTKKVVNEPVEQKRVAPVREPELSQSALIEQSEVSTLPVIQLAEVSAVELPTRFVTDVEPIKPLIEPFEEEEEMMIAGTVRKATTNVINKIINVVNDNTPTQVTKDVYVLKDDEGSFRLELGNIFAKNRSKKRK